MKDEFDDVTRDMFEKGPDKKVSKPVLDRAEPYLKKAYEKMDKSLGVTKETSPELQKSFAEKLSKVSKPSVSGGGGGGAGIPKVGPKKPMDMKKGGVTRADGCITKGHTKGRMV
jgi:hypothetical protein